MRILLAEDDINLNSSLTKKLQAQGITVDSCTSGDEALFLAKENIHDVILLDRMLPVMVGVDILKAIRAENIMVPVIFITALGTLNDKVTGLNLGADDYLVKPFAFEELMARIQCVTRRSLQLNQSGNSVITYGDISLDMSTNTLLGPSGSCTLSKRECTLLEVLLRSAGQTLSRLTILLKVWGPDSEVEEGNLDNYIFFIRRRLKQTQSTLNIKTIRGIGYMLTE